MVQGCPQQGQYPGFCGVNSNSRYFLCSEQSQEPQVLCTAHSSVRNPTGLREELKRLPGERSAGGKGPHQSLARGACRVREGKMQTRTTHHPDKRQPEPSISVPFRSPSPAARLHTWPVPSSCLQAQLLRKPMTLLTESSERTIVWCLWEPIPDFWAATKLPKVTSGKGSEREWLFIKYVEQARDLAGPFTFLISWDRH